MIIFFIFLLFLGSPKASRVLLLYEKAEMQLVSLFEEAQSADFQITKGRAFKFKKTISKGGSSHEIFVVFTMDIELSQFKI